MSCIFVAHAQNEEVQFAKFPLKISFGNHAVGFPFQHSFKAFNPHFSLGTEFGLNKNLKHQIYISSNLGFIRNKVIGNTIPLDVDFGYRYLHKTGLFLETTLGLGILKQYHPRNVYQYSESNETYDKISDKGLTTSLVGFKMGMGYDFSSNNQHPFRIGINHHFFIQTTYFEIDNFPIMPQSTTNISITYKFKKQ